MNILNNGRFGMVAGLSGTMKMAIRKSIVSSVDELQLFIPISW